MKERNLFLSVALFSLFGLFLTNNAIAAKQKPIVCNNTYALCNAARCQKLPALKDKVLCNCSIWKGKNIGYSTCKKRKMRVNSRGEKRLVSTFSFGGEHYRYLTCQSNTPWASCLDQPCIIASKSLNERRAFCICELKKTNAYVTFAGNCNKKYCSGKNIWSGATIKGNALLSTVLAKALGKSPSFNRACKK